jgi:hypothetical protein
MIVYAGEEEEYFSFISSEAWRALNDWMNYRERSGEQIYKDSWVMRDLWDTRVAQGRGLVTKPKKLSSLGIKRIMQRAIWAQGLRKKLEPGNRSAPAIWEVNYTHEAGLTKNSKIDSSSWSTCFSFFLISLYVIFLVSPTVSSYYNYLERYYCIHNHH